MRGQTTFSGRGKDSWMENTLVVVESPAKAKTIKKYLGPGYEVKASVGHIKDLPAQTEKGDRKSSRGPQSDRAPVVGVDIEQGFMPEYVVIPGKEKVIKELREAANHAGRVLLATDPDREGEAIAWHVSQELNKPHDQIYRVLFNELTEKTIKQAIQSPARLDENKYNAQQARRILDRIVGYQLSPLLWEKVQYGLSAGRVQSVALRLIVDRQNEIERFVPQEFWSINAELAGDEPPPFEAKLVEAGSSKVHIADAGKAGELVKQARENDFIVSSVKRKERSRKAPPPFITSTLQQDASRKLKMSGSRTMRIAQQLYEGMELGQRGSVGLITYMRTDSPRIAPEAVAAVRQHIEQQYGKDYLPGEPNRFKGRKSAQEAHEAIRPTALDIPPEAAAPYLDKAHLALYRLIWNRFVASQMAPAIFDQTTAEIACGSLKFRVTGSVLKFEGFLKVYQTAETDGASANEDDGRRLPPLHEGQKLNVERITPRQHFTQPPPAFNEASLIKELEEKGIGRPSTYAEIVSRIQKRRYVEQVDKKFRPTALGRIISRLLLDSFPDVLSTSFTAKMETELDRIEEGGVSWQETLQEFYHPFHDALKQAKEAMKNVKREGIPTGEACPECGHELVLRSGRYGIFLGCSSYPDCSFTTNIKEEDRQGQDPVPSDETCPTCGAQMLIKQSRTGPFLSCSRYPECRTAKPLTLGVPCPQCKTGEIVQKRSKKGKTFYSCSRYPDCDFSMWNMPVDRECPNPDCDSPILEEKRTKKEGVYVQCPKCKQKLQAEESQDTNDDAPAESTG